jgi:hypothetical protein
MAPDLRNPKLVKLGLRCYNETVRGALDYRYLRLAIATAGPAIPSIIAMFNHNTPVPAKHPARIP